MHVVLVSSPGASAAPHWSHAASAELGSRLAARGVDVAWLAAVRPAHALAEAPAGVRCERFELPPARGVGAVARESRFAPVEVALTRLLRERPVHAVVHVGIGARGTPNVDWLAERLGAVPFAFARAAEVVCHRGDLVDREHTPCADFLDAERCRRCCAPPAWTWPRPGADDFRNRADLLAGSLLACRTVFVPSAADVAMLTTFGVPARALAVAVDLDAVAALVSA
jgi:hypothetical protein